MKVLSWMTAILMVSGVAMTEAQTLLRSEPADGAKNVPLDIGEVRFHFDRDMNTGGWSFLVTKQGKFPPPEGNNRKPCLARHIKDFKYLPCVHSTHSAAEDCDVL